MNKKMKIEKGPPEINPYVFTILLFIFGAWCLYDGWITTASDMQEHRLFNQFISAVLFPWAIYDFFKVRKASQKRKGKRNKNVDVENNL